MLLPVPRGPSGRPAAPLLPGAPHRLAGEGGGGGPLPYLCTCRTKACTSWIRGSWLSGLALEREVDLP